MIQLGERKVQDFMTKDVKIVEDTDKLSDAIRILDENQLSATPVVDNQNIVVGLLSTSDLLEIFHETQCDLNALHCVTDLTRDFLIQLLTDAGDNTRVQDVMCSPVETISPNTNLVVAAQQLVKKKYHHLPVIDGEGQPIGMLSTFDFVRAIAEHGAAMSG